MKNETKLNLILFSLTICSLLFGTFFVVNNIQVARAIEIKAPSYKNNEILVKLNNRDKIYNLQPKDNENISQAIDRINGLDSVEYVEPNYLYTMSLEPTDTYYTQQTYLSQTQVHLAWNIINRSPNVTIAIIDTGIDMDHPDLVNNVWTNPKEISNNKIDDDKNGYVDDIHGWDFLTKSADPNPKYDEGYVRDGINHGTIIASIAAAQGGNQIGIAGVTWSAKIMPLRVLDGAGIGDTLHVAQAVDYAVNNGADIINLSFVGDGSSQTLEDSIKRAWEKGILVIAAAGNEIKNGIDLKTDPRYPICHDGANGENWVFGVASVDQNDRKASFSNFSHQYVDITAPGVGIFSALFYDPLKPEFNKEYGGNWTGTSVSTPQVAATAALIKAIRPGISLGELQEILKTSGDNIDRYNKPWKEQLGLRLNVYQAINKTRESIKTTYHGSNIAVGTVEGGGPHIRVFRENNLIDHFFSHSIDSRGGVNLVISDLEQDGEEEIITGAGSGLDPEVKIFDLKGNFKNKFLAYPKSFTGGIRVAVGDIDGDSQREIITVPGPGGGPQVRIFDSKGRLKRQFFVFDQDFKGGLEVATADVDNNGQEEIIIALGPGTIPGVRIYDMYGHFKTQFLAYQVNFRGGVRVVAVDIDQDGQKEIITVPGSGGGPHVRIFDVKGSLKNQFFTFELTDRGGLYVASGDSDNDGIKDIIIGSGRGRKPEIKIFDNQGNLKSQIQVYGDSYKLGVRVAAGQ